MIKLLKEVESLSQSEYLRNTDDYGIVNASDHESYALLLEEFQEAESDFMLVKDRLNNLWECIKENESDDIKSTYIRDLYEATIHCASEIIQLAGLCHKANNTIKNREDE